MEQKHYLAAAMLTESRDDDVAFWAAYRTRQVRLVLQEKRRNTR